MKKIFIILVVFMSLINLNSKEKTRNQAVTLHYVKMEKLASIRFYLDIRNDRRSDGTDSYIDVKSIEYSILLKDSQGKIVKSNPFAAVPGLRQGWSTRGISLPTDATLRIPIYIKVPSADVGSTSGSLNNRFKNGQVAISLIGKKSYLIKKNQKIEVILTYSHTALGKHKSSYFIQL